MLTKEQIMSVKARGFLRNRGTDCFSGRVVTVAGLFTPSELHTIAECAEKGDLHGKTCRRNRWNSV